MGQPHQPHHNPQLVGERSATRHGSDERQPHIQGGRPVTQGKSRRAIGNPPHVPSLATSSGAVSGIGLTLGSSTDQMALEMAQVEATYCNDGVMGGAGPKEVMNRRTSSRRMNRIYGGASSSSIKRVDHPNAP